jgi:hypothetical protein
VVPFITIKPILRLPQEKVAVLPQTKTKYMRAHTKDKVKNPLLAKATVVKTVLRAQHWKSGATKACTTKLKRR